MATVCWTQLLCTPAMLIHLMAATWPSARPRTCTMSDSVVLEHDLRAWMLFDGRLLRVVAVCGRVSSRFFVAQGCSLDRCHVKVLAGRYGVFATLCMGTQCSHMTW